LLDDGILVESNLSEMFNLLDDENLIASNRFHLINFIEEDSSNSLPISTNIKSTSVVVNGVRTGSCLGAFS
jgi:hypothetical protein